MIDYIYYNNDLNRWFWRDVWHSFKNVAWNFLEENHKLYPEIPPETLKQLRQKFGISDGFQICGAKIIVQKN